MNQRIMVLGGGSIGTRHARNLIDLGADVTVADPDPGRAAVVADSSYRWPVTGPHDLAEFDGLVVATPTSAHAEHVCWGLEAGVHVLVEKPLAQDLQGVERILAIGEPARVMVGLNLRYFDPVQRFVEIVHGGVCGRLLSLCAWFGSYLPDWRPATDYRTTYSAQSDLGGGVLLDAVHELDLLLWLTGSDLEVVGAHLSISGQLEIDVEDRVRAILWDPVANIPVGLSLDYLSRRYRRGLEAIGSEATVRLDWSRRLLEIEGANACEVISDRDLDWELARSYESEAQLFLSWIAGEPTGPTVDAREGGRSVSLAAVIREVAAWK